VRNSARGCPGIPTWPECWSPGEGRAIPPAFRLGVENFCKESILYLRLVQDFTGIVNAFLRPVSPVLATPSVPASLFFQEMAEKITSKIRQYIGATT
jgi:hypothetical protein